MKRDSRGGRWFAIPPWICQALFLGGIVVFILGISPITPQHWNATYDVGGVIMMVLALIWIGD